MSTSEKQVIDGFLKVIAHVASKSSKSAVDIANQWNEKFGKFTVSFTSELKSGLDKTERVIQELRANKLDASCKEELNQKMTHLQETIIHKYRSFLEEFSKEATTMIGESTKKVDDFISTYDSEVIHKKIKETMDRKMKEQLEKIDTNKKETQALRQEFEGQVKGLLQQVTQLMQTNFGPEAIGQFIGQMPEYQVVKEAAEKIQSAPPTESLPNVEAIKKSITNLTSELTEVKQNYQETKVILDTLRTQGLGLSVEPREFNQDVALQRMEHIEKEVQVIYNHIQFIETTIKVKASQLEEREDQRSTDGSGNSNNKRARIDLDGNSVNHDQCAVAISHLQAQHQKLLDFILQSKDTVLDESFQQRLEAVVFKIEQVLMNHERFIHFLIDPFAASKADKVSISTAPVPEGTLSPAMIDAIRKLIQKKSEEVAVPLERRIKLLEEKLQARSS
ncbi:hypothetical protein BD770DRAFT_406763 [Pilaira anomala]|nr:hypothetical protein BD770DRAFT_406763 [Pilaira anomala]